MIRLWAKTKAKEKKLFINRNCSLATSDPFNIFRSEIIAGILLFDLNMARSNGKIFILFYIPRHNVLPFLSNITMRKKYFQNELFI
jgi:hypothetical protein